MGQVTPAEIIGFFQELAKRFPRSATIFLLGGSALQVLGNIRPTLDIDYDAQLAPDEVLALQNAIEQLAQEQHLEFEYVPIAEFIPLPEEANRRHRLVGQFGHLAVYVYDPYSIALSKVARGLESDLQDVVWMIEQKLISFTQVAQFVQAAIPRARNFDIDPTEFKEHLESLRQMLQDL